MHGNDSSCWILHTRWWGLPLSLLNSFSKRDIIAFTLRQRKSLAVFHKPLSLGTLFVDFASSTSLSVFILSSFTTHSLVIMSSYTVRVPVTRVSRLTILLSFEVSSCCITGSLLLRLVVFVTLISLFVPLTLLFVLSSSGGKEGTLSDLPASGSDSVVPGCCVDTAGYWSSVLVRSAVQVTLVEEVVLGNLMTWNRLTTTPVDSIATEKYTKATNTVECR